MKSLHFILPFSILLAACNGKDDTPDDVTDTAEPNDTDDTDDTGSDDTGDIDTSDTDTGDTDTSDTDTGDTDTGPVNDADGDGFSSDDGDCDDNDPSIYPGAEDIPGDGIDQDCVGGDAEVSNTSLGSLQPNDLIITEIFNNPRGTDEEIGEWFELFNNTNQTINIIDLEIVDGELIDPDTNALYSFTIDTDLEVAPFSFALLAANIDTDGDGVYDGPTGIQPDFVYDYPVYDNGTLTEGGFILTNGGDIITIKYGQTIFDTVAYDGGPVFPDPNGNSISLDPQYYEIIANDSGASWCEALTAFYTDPVSGDVQYGTPGAQNDTCPVPVDQDGDGYRDDLDCNDDPNDPNAPFINPGATDADTDGIDQNCDGVDGPDSDGDGFADINTGGDDCDDGNPNINPNGAEIPGNGIDEDCDGVDGAATADLTISDLNLGDLVINEVIQNPDAVGDNDGEWFEVWIKDTLNGTLELQGLTIRDQDSDSFMISSSLVVNPGDYVVFAKNADSTTNGGVTVHYEYGGDMSLANGDDEILLEAGPVLVDVIEYDNGQTFPDPNGASMNLDPTLQDAGLNDQGSNWCVATSSYGAGDLGTPGTANDSCN